jgi:hypothetical protein
MNRYIDFYHEEKLERLNFKEPAKKALKYGLGGIALGVFGVLLAPLVNLNDYSIGNLLLGLFIGLVIFVICFRSFYKLKKLNSAKKILLTNIDEIEEKLFAENSVLREKTLLGVTDQNQLFIMGRNIEGKFFAYLATSKYLHYSPVRLAADQEKIFESLSNGEKPFFKIKESF